MLDGVMLLWFILTAMSVLFVAIDIRTTPEATVLKWGFVILTLFTGPFGAFFYVLGCREPLPGTHEQYVSAPWRQVLGSTMHCAAGDGLGIIAGGAIGGPAETRSRHRHRPRIRSWVRIRLDVLPGVRHARHGGR